MSAKADYAVDFGSVTASAFHGQGDHISEFLRLYGRPFFVKLLVLC